MNLGSRRKNMAGERECTRGLVAYAHGRKRECVAVVGIKYMFRPIRERCPFANMNVMFAKKISHSRTRRISANMLNILHSYV